MARRGLEEEGLGSGRRLSLLWFRLVVNCVAVGAHLSGCTAGGSFPWAKLEFKPTSSFEELPLSAPQLLGEDCLFLEPSRRT